MVQFLQVLYWLAQETTDQSDATTIASALVNSLFLPLKAHGTRSPSPPPSPAGRTAGRLMGAGIALDKDRQRLPQLAADTLFVLLLDRLLSLPAPQKNSPKKTQEQVRVRSL